MTTLNPSIPTPASPRRMSTGRLGMGLFLASEAMFFVALIGATIMLRMAEPQVFAEHRGALNRPLASVNTAILLLSSAAMLLAVRAVRSQKRGRTIAALLLTLLLGGAFLTIKGVEYAQKTHHFTIIANESGQPVVYDGEVADPDADTIQLIGARAAITDNSFNINQASTASVLAMSGNTAPADYSIRSSTLTQRMWYGPWKSNFFACYYVLTAVHAVHVLGGLIALFILLIQTFRRRASAAAIEYTGLYWQFIDGVWLVLFVLLYCV